ncbi:MAG: MFS transporter [Bacteroidales bacterium]|nr:MFS transporter [Bacteroidales bacterium]
MAEEVNNRLWNGNYTKVLAANFCMYFAFYLITPLLPIYLSERFLSTKDTIGAVLSGYILLAFLIRPFSGYLADSFSRKRVLVFFAVTCFILFGGYLAASSLLMFTIVRTLHGGPFGGFTVANSTMAIDVLPSSRRTEGIGLYGISNNIGTALAPTVGILIYKYIGSFNIIFWLAFLVSFIGFYLTTRINPPQKEIKEEKFKLSLDRFFLKRGWIIAVNILFFGYCYGVLSSYLAIYGKEALGITGGTGAYFMLLSCGLILSRLYGRKSLKKGKLLSNALWGIIISTVGYTIFIVWSSPISYYGSALLIGLGNGHMWPAFQNMIINLAENNRRATANSTILTSWDLGMGIGILLGGIFSEKMGYTAAFYSSVFMHFAGLATYFVATKGHYKRNALR